MELTGNNKKLKTQLTVDNKLVNFLLLLEYYVLLRIYHNEEKVELQKLHWLAAWKSVFNPLHLSFASGVTVDLWKPKQIRALPNS